MAVDPRRLKVLLAVRREGGILAASRVLHLTPSAVSQQVARLEAEVGQPVLDRQPGGAVLTPAGEVLAESAESVEAELIEVERKLAELSGELSGTVAIGAPQSVLRSVLVPLVSSIAARHAGLTIQLRQAESSDASELLRTGVVDVLVLEADSPLGRSRPRGTRDVPVLDEPWLLVSPTSVPTPTRLDDLASATWLGVDASAAAYQATERALAGFERRPPTAHRYDDYNVALAMVSGGLGVALVPALALLAVDATGLRVSALAGLGTRRLVARCRSSRAGMRREVTAVLGEVVHAAQSTARTTAPVAVPSTTYP